MTTAARPGLDPKPTGLRSLEDSPEVRANSRAECDAERNKIQQAFLDSASVHATLQALCEMAERNTQEGLQAASHAHNLEPEGLAVLAIGGFGRQVLFPYSDLDILLLFENVRAEQKLEAVLAEFTRTLWDRGFRVSSAARTLEESKRVVVGSIPPPLPKVLLRPGQAKASPLRRLQNNFSNPPARIASKSWTSCPSRPKRFEKFAERARLSISCRRQSG